MSDVQPIESRIRAIEARVASLANLTSNDSSGSPLGFGLALQAAQDEAPTTVEPPTDTTAAGSSSNTGLAGTGLAGTGLAGIVVPGSGPPLPIDDAAVNETAIDTAAISETALNPVAAPSQPTGLTPATKLAGSYGRLEPPEALVPFGNGKVPTTELEPVGDTGHRLYAPAAQALTTLIADAKADGVTVGITDSYRPLEVQQRLAKEKGLYSQGGLAATPGTSNHGWGMATDLRLDNDALVWMRKNAWRYGYVEDVPREPWHWTYRPDEK